MRKFSIVITSCKYPEHLLRCLVSIKQAISYPWCENLEIIVTDDGTPGDENRKIADQFGVAFITGEHTANLGIVLNRGISKTSFDDLILLSQDMILQADYLDMVEDEFYPGDNTIIYGEVYKLSDPAPNGRNKIIGRNDRLQIPTFRTVFRPFFESGTIIEELIPYWTIADALDTIVKKDIFDRFPLSEEFYGFPNFLFPEWLSRLWFNDIKFQYCPELVVFHQNHVLSSALPENAEIYKKNEDIYHQKLQATIQEAIKK